MSVNLNSSTLGISLRAESLSFSDAPNKQGIIMNDVASPNFEALPIDADRLCEGISKIGYKPSAALMDVADNAVAAQAKRLRISMELRPDASLGTKGGVARFRVIDDGRGMSGSEVKSALQLGTPRDYPENSLSKFGLGLKSAGFSLGRRISVLSKQGGQLSQQWIVDRDVIRDQGAYGAFSEAPDPDLAAALADVESGTIVEVSKLLPKQDSALKIRRELTERLGIAYYEFLAREVEPLQISLRYGAKEDQIDPVDFLFLSDATTGFDPDTYDCKTPVKVLDQEIENPLDPGGPMMRLEVAILPQDRMANFGGFSEIDRAKIRGYRIGRENDGFFIYRNGRLILWGEHLAGVRRDDLTFRARLSFTDAHDDLLHVDVSKQHIMVPEDVEETLATLIRLPLSQSRIAADLCRKLTNLGSGVEGEEFNRRTEVFEEEDPDESGSPLAPEVRRQRRAALDEQSQTINAQVEEAEKADQHEDGDQAEVEAFTADAVFERIRYSSGIVGSNVALAGFDPDYETFVRVNKNHPFYDLVLNSLPPADRTRQAIESLLFAAAVAENKVLQNTTTIDLEILQTVFEKYRRALSLNLEAWLMTNQDLFG